VSLGLRGSEVGERGGGTCLEYLDMQVNEDLERCRIAGRDEIVFLS
jgi:hypothetical protein